MKIELSPFMKIFLTVIFAPLGCMALTIVSVIILYVIFFIWYMSGHDHATYPEPLPPHPPIEYTIAYTAEHVIVNKEPGRFAGWPCNNGMWSWGDEIVVGFVQGTFIRLEGEDHPISPDDPEFPRFARSLDGGETWSIEFPSWVDAQGKQVDPIERTEPVDFSHPDFAMRLRANRDAPFHPRIYYSFDRCKTWEGPYKLPTFDLPEVMARTDYIVYGKDEALALITCAKTNLDEGRVFATRTTDGGRTWTWASWVGPEPKGFAVMSSTEQLPDGTLITALRRLEGEEALGNLEHWIDIYQSKDRGATWTLLGERVADTGGNHGNPASLTLLADGRVAMVYGFRSAPYGMRAKISDDGGVTWGEEIVLRDDAGEWDLGYPVTAQRADGKLVTMYYYNDGLEDPRYIAATIWDAGVAE